jgi:environmental stress-induced protein Ves
MSENAVHCVRLHEVAPAPWKNGGGVTRELLAWPNANDWAIRVSIADIEQDGVFSSFPDVERHFAVLSGNGVRLEGFGDVRADHTVVRFDGERAPYCELIDGPTRDLNVMIRRGAGRGELAFDDAARAILGADGTTVHGVYCETSETLLWAQGRQTVSLKALSRQDATLARLWRFSICLHSSNEA